jgi:hypothetical protein
MRQLVIVSRIYLVLSIINFALAAPLVTRERHEVRVDVVDIAKDGTAVSQTPSRWDSRDTWSGSNEKDWKDASPGPESSEEPEPAPNSPWSDSGSNFNSPPRSSSSTSSIESPSWPPLGPTHAYPPPSWPDWVAGWRHTTLTRMATNYTCRRTGGTTRRQKSIHRHQTSRRQTTLLHTGCRQKRRQARHLQIRICCSGHLTTLLRGARCTRPRQDSLRSLQAGRGRIFTNYIIHELQNIFHPFPIRPARTTLIHLARIRQGRQVQTTLIRLARIRQAQTTLIQLTRIRQARGRQQCQARPTQGRHMALLHRTRVRSHRVPRSLSPRLFSTSY